MNWNLVFNKIVFLTKEERVSFNSVGMIWKNKYKYLLYIIIVPNELKTLT